MPGLGGFSRYELQERIGIGGMAEVFRARAFDASGTPHDVVVKKILPHHSEENDFRTMFMDEARIASKLDHPNVVKVLDLGRLDGDLFLTMEYVEGTDLLRLAEWMEGAGRTMPIPTALHLSMEVLKGLHHAHTRVDAAGVSLGIVHRDVTPQNVLIGTQGSVKLTDFGIARAANRISHTMVGTIKGNLLYSSPEQVSGAPIDARADVYSTGILLHRLLGGQHAFEGDDLPKIYQRALSGDIPPVSRINPSIPTNLDRIVARATALVPDQRFATADELRRALEDFLLGKQLEPDLKALCSDVRAMKSGLRAAAKGEPSRVLVSQGGSDQSVLSSVIASPAAPRVDAPTSVQRHAAALDDDGPTTVQSIPLDDPTAGRARLANAPRRQEPWPSAESVEAVEEKTIPIPSAPAVAPPPIVEDVTTRNTIPPPRTPSASDPALPESGGARVASTIVLPASPPAPVPVPSPPATPSRSGRAPTPPPATPSRSGGTPMLSSRPPVPVTPDPADVAPTAIMAPDLVSGGAPREPVLATRPSAPLPEVAPPDVAVPSRTPPPRAPSPEPMAAPVAAPEVRVPGAVRTPPPGSPPPSPGALPPPPSVTSANAPARGARSSAPLPPWETPRTRGGTPPPARATEGPAIGGTVELDDSPPAPVMGKIVAPALAAAFSEPEPPTASPFDDLVEPETSTYAAQPGPALPPPAPVAMGKAASASLEGHTHEVVAVAAVRAGRFVVSASHDHTLRVWDLTLQKTQALLKGHNGPVTCVALGDDGGRVISGGADQTVRLWNTESGQVVASMKGHVEPVLACAVAPDGRTALSGGQDRSVRLWDLSTGREQLVMQGHEQAVAVLAYAGDGTIAVSASLDGMIQMWNLLDGSMLAMFPTGVLGLRALALARDGRRLVFGGADGQVRMWDAEQGAPLLTFDGMQGALLGAALSPDGLHVVTAGQDGTARLWDLLTGKPGGVYGTHSGPLHSVGFAIEGHALVGATGRRVCVWDIP